MKVNSTQFRKITLMIALFCMMLAIFAVFQNVYATELSGTVYTKDLELARFSLLTINTTPAQRIILENGTYLIKLDPGTYIVQATYHDGKNKYEDNATLEISSEGEYTYDFITFNSIALTEQELPVFEDVVPKEQQVKFSAAFIYILMAVLCLIIIGFIIFFTLYKRKTRHNKNTNEDDASNNSGGKIGVDLTSIIKILKDEGGRASQKELRKQIPCSEAKMSMMLTELEHKSKIERIKKGRANLIILK